MKRKKKVKKSRSKWSLYISSIVLSMLIISYINIQNNENTENNNRLATANMENVQDNTIKDEDIIKDETILETSSYIQSLEDIINNYIDEYSIAYGQDVRQQIGLVYMDLNSKESIDINPNKEFIAASTYKVMINIVAYSEAIKGSISLNDNVYYSDVDYEDGESIVDTYSNKPYSIQELLDASIIYSDNIASRMLFRFFGGFDNTMNMASKVLAIDIETEGNYESASNLKIALEYIYNNKDNEHYNHLLNTMTQTIYNDRLDKYLPEEIVAHKVGMYEGYIHDVGIILTDKPYILSVFTEDLIESYEFIAGLSKIIYEYQVSQ